MHNLTLIKMTVARFVGIDVTLIRPLTAIRNKLIASWIISSIIINKKIIYLIKNK